MISNDEMERQRFLAYMRTTCWKSDLTTFIDEEGDEVFYEQWVQGAWMGWQASRNCIEIKLPTTTITAEIGPAVSLEKLMAILACNGIKVKT